MASGYDMRVGDAERDAAANDLREHFASGRLTQDELNERLDQTFAAKTRAELSAALHRPAVVDLAGCAARRHGRRPVWGQRPTRTAR